MLSRVYLSFLVVLIFAVPARSQNRETETNPQPTFISAPKLVYPQEAKAAGIGGKITVRISVGENGEVLSVGDAAGLTELCKGGSKDPRLAALRSAVVDSLKQAKFSPAMKDGKPVKTTVWFTSTFDPTSDPGGEKKIVDLGMAVVRRALRMAKPDYPAAARPSRPGGAVPIRVVIDESGDVFTAEPIGGNPLLRASAVDAACKAKFSPMEIDGKPVRITGVITYIFTPY